MHPADEYGWAVARLFRKSDRGAGVPPDSDSTPPPATTLDPQESAPAPTSVAPPEILDVTQAERRSPNRFPILDVQPTIASGARPIKAVEGEAFDVTADKKQTDFRRREPTNKASTVYESAYEIVLRNAKTEAVTVTVREPVPGDWTMLEESQKHAKVASGTAEWRINVPAGGSSTLKYRVLTRW